MLESSPGQQKLDALLARLVEETITSEEFAELESLLDGNPEAQRRYLHYLGLHADLREAGALTAVDASGPRSRGSRRWSSAAMLGAAAAAALVVAIVLLSQRGTNSDEPGQAQTQSPVPIARIAELNGSVAWTGNGGQLNYHLSVDDAIGGGTLETLATNSWAEIVFLDGSSVWVSGPAVLTLSEGEEGKLIRLREGDLSVEVAPQSDDKPMRLVTPTAEAEVLGTQFNVTADSVSTRLTVNKGLVRVTRLADGKAQEVPADHFVVAALERKTDFVAVPRRQYVEIWKSELPRDLLQGTWKPGVEEGTGALRAEAHLFRGDFGERESPILLHSAVMDLSAGDLPPIRLTEGGRFRVRGRLERSHQVHFGFTTHRFRGGFSGKFNTWREIEVDKASGGSFEVELRVGDFPRMKECFPESPVGHEIVYLWIQTVREDAGLEVIGVELLEAE